MKNRIFLSAFALANLIVTASPVRAELVFEEEDRQATRDVMATGDRAIVTQTIAVHPAAVQGTVPESVQQARPMTVASSSPTESDNLSRAEMIRRSRVRKEIQNEDILQARIEELRMKDEQKRTGQILVDPSESSSESMTSGINAENSANALPQNYSSPQLKQMETVTVTTSSAAPAPMAVAPVVIAEKAMVDEDSEKTQIYISPRVGYGSSTSLNGLQNSPRFALGGALGILFSENMAFELGYTYLEQGFSNPYATFFVPGVNQNEFFNYKQNVVDASLKLFFLGKNSKLKPFVGGGLAYSKGYLNYDQRIRAALAGGGVTQYGQTDYEVDAFLGQLSLGTDLALTKMVSVSAMFTYHGNFTSRESFANSNTGFYTQETYEKQQVGSTVARSGFYTMGIGLNFLF